MRQQQHGDTPIGRRGEAAPSPAGRKGRGALGVAVAAADTHAMAYLFPALQADPANPLPEAPTTQAHLVALGVAMQGAGGDSDIPAAYTYFGQFVDHDVTLEGVTGGVDLNGAITPMTPAAIAGLVNTRTGTLDLDNVYGAPAPRDPADAARMQLGHVSATGSRPPGKTADNDLPRRGRDLTDDNRDREALIGDPRNDENLVVAQLHTAFLKAHNVLVGQGLTFDQAQTALRQHYQHIVVHDFLTRIADPSIVADVLRAARQHGPAGGAQPAAGLPAAAAHRSGRGRRAGPDAADGRRAGGRRRQRRAARRAGGFADRTPLWYYVLAEAAHVGGNRLGPVGSTIVAEVLIGLLQRSDDSILGVADWAPSLPSRTPGTFTLLDLLVFAGVATDGRAVDPVPDGGSYTVQPGDSLSRSPRASSATGAGGPRSSTSTVTRSRTPG